MNKHTKTQLNLRNIILSVRHLTQPCTRVWFHLCEILKQTKLIWNNSRPWAGARIDWRKRMREIFGAMEMSSVLIGFWVTQMYGFLRIHQIVSNGILKICAFDVQVFSNNCSNTYIYTHIYSEVLYLGGSVCLQITLKCTQKWDGLMDGKWRNIWQRR